MEHICIILQLLYSLTALLMLCHVSCQIVTNTILWHDITSQKTWLFSNTTAITLHFANNDYITNYGVWLLSIPRNSSALIRQNRKLITVFTKHTTELLASNSSTESPPTLKPHIPKMHYFDTQMFLCSVLNWFSGCWLRQQSRLQMVHSVRQYTDFTTALFLFKLPLRSTRVKVI